MIGVLGYNYANEYPRDVCAPGGMTKPNRRLDIMSVTRIPICGIYRITNLINGKVYVGQSRDINKRWRDHKSSIKLSRCYLYNAIREYGIENFAFDIIEECDIEQLDNLERKHIVRFNSIRPCGYNVESGGNANKVISLEQKRRHSESIKGNHFRRIAVSKYTLDGVYIATYESAKEAGDLSGTINSAIVNCCKDKKGHKSAGGYMWKYAKGLGNESIPVYFRDRTTAPVAAGEVLRRPVNQYSKSGEYIKTFQSGTNADASFSSVTRGHINDCCMGNRKSAFGYSWRYAE